MAKYEDGSYGSAAGIALIAKVLAGRCAMKYTRVAVGKGNIPDDKTPKTMTEPADYVMDAVIAGITNPVDGECQVTVQINSANVDKGFYCTAVVLYASKTVGGSPNSKHRYGMAADWRMVNRSINPVALGIIAAQYFKAVGIYWYDGCAIVHTDTRDAKATWLCDAPRHYPSTTYQKFILPTIRRGCTGDANRAATKMLQRLLGLTPDGIFGEDTENALLKAQEAHGLAVDGICGPASWRAISGANKYL